MKNGWQIGVDEVGRGPLAGPVGVGVALVPLSFDWTKIPGVTDSKKLSEKKRETIYEVARALMTEGELFFAVAMVGAKEIDSSGIVPSINKAMYEALTEVLMCVPRPGLGQEYEEVQVLLDGGLKAPEQFTNQETIIKGDAKESVIGLASIVAKVTRDRHMEQLAKEKAYQVYDFAVHKGYGTKAHRTAIFEHGLSPEHRASYCKNIKNMVL